MYQSSKHIEFGKYYYKNQSGVEVVPVYVTSQPSFYFIPRHIYKMLERNDIGSIPELHLKKLLNIGILTKKESEKLSTAHGRRKAVNCETRTFVLLPSSYCNMGCAYCGQVHIKGKISPNHRKLVENRVVGAIKSGKYKVVDVRWFGAEPLMAFDIASYLGQKFLSNCINMGIEYRSQITTNGTLLDHRKMKILDSIGIRRIDITIDGPKEIHNQSRPMKNGSKSFDKIVNIVANSLEAYPHIQFVLRTNITKNNAKYIAEYLNLAQIFHGVGFGGGGLGLCGLGLVGSPSP